MPTEMTFENSWEVAEKTVFDILVNATGEHPGTGAFIGRRPPVANCFAIYPDNPADATYAWNATRLKSIRMDYAIEAAYADRSRALKVAMQMLALMMIKDQGNVSWFRPKVYPVPHDEFVPIANIKKPVLLWVWKMPCDFVFRTEPQTT